MPQQRHRIDARREPGRPECGAHCHDGQQDRNRDERPRIARIDTIQLRRQETAGIGRRMLMSSI